MIPKALSPRYHFSMRYGWSVLALSLFVFGCTTVENDIATNSLSAAVNTKITFIPPNREQAIKFLQIERHVHKSNTDPMRERMDALQRGRNERFAEVRNEFPDCVRQKHCESDLARGDIKRFERYRDLAKEIHEYDMQIVEIETSLHAWDYRLDLRERAILNRFLVHELLAIPEVDNRFQGIQVHSLESFETRKQTSMHLLRFAGDDVVPSVIGDLDFRMLGHPVDEAAVLATFDVYLMPRIDAPKAPTRFVVTFLVNTHQRDLRYYENDYLREWSVKLAEPFQKELREAVFCGLYSIAGEMLLPKLPFSRPKSCLLVRNDLQMRRAEKFQDRFGPERWLIPLAYYPLAHPYKTSNR